MTQPISFGCAQIHSSMICTPDAVITTLFIAYWWLVRLGGLLIVFLWRWVFRWKISFVFKGALFNRFSFKKLHVFVDLTAHTALGAKNKLYNNNLLYSRTIYLHSFIWWISIFNKIEKLLILSIFFNFSALSWF